MAWDASFRNVLKRFLLSKTTEVVTEFEVPTVNLRLDFLIQHQGSLIYPFDSCRQTVIGEFKSERDRFNLDELRKTIAKSYLYLTSATLN